MDDGIMTIEGKQKSESIFLTLRKTLNFHFLVFRTILSK